MNHQPDAVDEKPPLLAPLLSLRFAPEYVHTHAKWPKWTLRCRTKPDFLGLIATAIQTFHSNRQRQRANSVISKDLQFQLSGIDPLFIAVFIDFQLGVRALFVSSH